MFAKDTWKQWTNNVRLYSLEVQFSTLELLGLRPANCRKLIDHLYLTMIRFIGYIVCCRAQIVMRYGTRKGEGSSTTVIEWQSSQACCNVT